MALVDYAFITVSDVKTYRGITGSSYDTLLEMLINAATDRIEQYLGGRRIKTSGSDIVEYHDGDYLRVGKSSIFVKNLPIRSVTSVSYSLQDDYSNPTWQNYFASNEYIVDKEIGQIKILSVIPYNVKQLRVTYKGGYDASEAPLIPQDLKLAAIMTVARLYDTRKSQGINNESVGGGSIQWGTGDVSAPFGFTNDVKSILDGYKSFVF